MLALILLVVLGGGIGLMAVSLAESTKPATGGAEPTRGPDPATSDPEDHAVDDGDAESEAVESREAGPDPLPHPVAPAIELLEPVVVPAPAAVTPPTPAPRPDPRSVPRAFTAIEGTYAEVANAPVWRRAISLVGIAVIALAAGVGIAGLAAAVVGAAAEVINNTIG